MTVQLFLIYLLNISFLAWVIQKAYKKIVELSVAKFYYPALVFKVICGISLGLIYTFYYEGGDTILFFEKANSLLKLPKIEFLNEVFITSIPHEQRSILPITKITSLVLSVTGSNYWLASIYFSLFSFAGTFYFVKQLSIKYPALTNSASIAFLFFPSIVFWSSGILKESVVFGIMMFMLGFFMTYLNSKKINFWHLILSVLGAWLIILIKYYIAAVFLPILMIVFIISIIINRNLLGSLNPIYQYLGILLLALGVFYWATTIQFNLDLSRVYSVVKANQVEILRISDQASVINYLDETGSTLMILVNLLIALFSGLFRPLIPELSSIAQIFSSIENILILALFILFLRTKRSLINQNKFLVAGLILFILTLSSLLAYSSPNLGTLARYKVYYMPFFLFLVLIDNPAIKWFNTNFSRSSS
ncbi:MAG: hypothetical protein ACI9GZ_001713 [Bacteroidia bacterium]|jgi:hypothetical protein